MTHWREIQFEPALSPVALLRGATGGPLPATLRGDHVELLFCGTAAVHRAARALRLTSSDVVLMPDYNCGIEVDAVLQSGARVEFYRIRRDTSIDLADLDARVRPPVRAIYVIHYFGTVHDLEAVAAIARNRNTLLIEDCAHSLFSTRSDRPTGTSGDVAIFSPRKILPLVDGGALSWRLPHECEPEPLSAPSAAHTVREVFQSLGRYGSRSHNLMMRVLGRALRRASNIVDRMGPAGKPLSDVGSEDFGAVKPRLGWRMSGLSRRLLQSVDEAAVISRRRRNYLYLANRLPDSRDMTPLYGALPDGACPLYFPLVVAERDRAYGHLKAHRIEAFRYWSWKHPSVPEEGHADAAYLRNHVLCLPVHQDLDDDALSRVVEVLETCLR